MKKSRGNTAEALSWDIAKASAYGGVLMRANDELLLREPSNHYDGYVWTFAKGRPEPSDTPQQTALREVLEETGYHAQIIGVLPGVFAGGTTTNAYFVMRPIGVPRLPDWETESTRWVGFAEAAQRIEQTVNAKGRKRDLDVLAAVRLWLESNRGAVVGEEDGVVTAGDWDTCRLPGQ